MATAGMPPRAAPSSARSTSSSVALRAKADPSANSAAPSRAQVIRRLRPMRSDSAPENTSEMASVSVEMDSVQLAWAGVSANWRANSGISGCTQ